MKSTEHPRIPSLPKRPRVHSIAGQISRSYTTGREGFSRACQGETVSLTITSQEAFPADLQARLLASLNPNGHATWDAIPFERADDRTLACGFTPKRPGFHSFRAEFSKDNGATWLGDTVPDAWMLVDPPQVDALRLYTLIPTVSGTIDDWKAELARVRGMGFNAMHLLPITTMDSSESPYSANDLFSVDPGYLEKYRGEDGLSQVEEFVEAARSLDIRLCFDLVLNHVGVDSKMARRAPDWIVPDETESDGLKRAGYWTEKGWQTWRDLVLINYDHPSEAIRSEIWSYMTDYALFWAKYANDTVGFVRFDNLHSSNHDFIWSLTQTLHTEYPELALYAEYFTDDRTLINTGPQWGLNLILATPWDYKFAPKLREYLKFIHRISGHVRYLMPITSHDCGSPAQEFGDRESTVPRYVAAALLGTGATGIPQGVEFGESEKVQFIGRRPKMDFPQPALFAPFLVRVNGILAEYAAFRQGENCSFVDGDHPAVIAAFRKDASGQAVGFLVVCNFDTTNWQSISVDLSPFLTSKGPFPCRELISGAMIMFGGPQMEIKLPPCSARVWKFTNA